MALQGSTGTYRTPALRAFYLGSGVLVFLCFLIFSGHLSIKVSLHALPWTLDSLEDTQDFDHASTKTERPFSPSLTPDSGKFVNASTAGEENDATLVMASVKSTNTSWLRELDNYDHKVYVVDDWSAENEVPLNKGSEAMVYLTYIIDHYDELAPVTAFVHADRYQWHNDDPDYDNLRLLRRLNRARVLDQGYVNLRCVWWVGCDTDLFPLQKQKEYEEELEKDPHFEPEFDHIYAEAWEYMMPGRAVPESVQVACCAQFAASRDAIHGHSREDYLRYREWLLRSKYDDGTTGRVFEFLWHILFGKEAKSCPTAQSCYCDTYGICDLQCNDDGDCGTYEWPPDDSHFPEAWPYIDFDGNPRQPHMERIGNDSRR